MTEDRTQQRKGNAHREKDKKWNGIVEVHKNSALESELTVVVGAGYSDSDITVKMALGQLSLKHKLNFAIEPLQRGERK